MAASNPTTWPNLNPTREWLSAFPPDTEVWRLPSGGYYAGSAQDFDEDDPEAIYQGTAGELLAQPPYDNE